MVFSNKHVLDLSGLDGFRPLSSVDKIIISDRLVNINEYIEEDYYTDKNFKEDFGLEKDFFDTIVNSMYQFTVVGDEANQQKIDNFFDSMIDRYGFNKIFAGKKNILSAELTALDPRTNANYIKMKYLAEIIDENTYSNFMLEMMTDKAEPAMDCMKYAKDYRGFRAYKKDYIDKLTSKKDKLTAALAFIYAERSFTQGPLEKIAVRYLMDISGLGFAFNNEIVKDNINKKRPAVKAWLSEHKKPKVFRDLSLLDKNQRIKEFVYQFIVSCEFAIYNLNLTDIKEINPTNLQHLALVLDEYENDYSDSKKSRELFIYLFYAVSHIAERCSEYSEQYLDSILNYKRLAEDRILVEAKLKMTIDIQKQQLKAKQELLNKLQLNYDRLANKELANLQRRLDKCIEDAEKLQVENESLKGINNILENRLKEIEPEEKEEKDIRPNTYVENRLQKLNILVMGGHQIWQNKIKEVYPYFNYIDSDDVNFDINIVRNADIVLFNTLHCSHTLYYKMKNNTNNGRSDNKNKIVYIGSNNLMYFKDLVASIVLNKNAD